MRRITLEDGSVLEYETARDLLTDEIEPPKWYIPGLITDGVTMLAGPSKVGKSLLSLNIAIRRRTRRPCTLKYQH